MGCGPWEFAARASTWVVFGRSHIGARFEITIEYADTWALSIHHAIATLFGR